MPAPNTFNIRVYGLLFNTNRQVLVTDEYRMGMYMTKFPGGGLDYGEGTLDCLKREFMEELGIKIEVEKHFYTTDYFQEARFFPNMQLLSIYYRVRSNATDQIRVTTIINANLPTEGSQSFRWVALNQLNPAEFTFPIDKKVVELLLENPI